MVISWFMTVHDVGQRSWILQQLHHCQLGIWISASYWRSMMRSSRLSLVLNKLGRRSMFLFLFELIWFGANFVHKSKRNLFNNCPGMVCPSKVSSYAHQVRPEPANSCLQQTHQSLWSTTVSKIIHHIISISTSVLILAQEFAKESPS